MTDYIEPGDELNPVRPGGPSRLFIMRPVATTLLMVALLLAGIIAYRSLPLSALPQVDYPTIQVRTLYPGGAPDVMALTVTRAAGTAVRADAGADSDDLEFVGGRFGDHAAIRSQPVARYCRTGGVQAAINAAQTLLPADLPAPPVYAKVNPADAPVLSLGVSSKTRPLGEVEGIVERQFSNKIAQESGVGLVSLSGGERPAVRITAKCRADGRA